jgi:hypothetical protein
VRSLKTFWWQSLLVVTQMAATLPVLADDLAAAGAAALGASTVGYAWDEDGAWPRALIRLSTTTANGVEVLQDYGSTYASSSATHRLALYRALSAALVFGASTPMRQATANLFAGMGARPATLQTGLTPATASTDTVGPAAAITALAAGAPVTIAGTATDSGGGTVGGSR